MEYCDILLERLVNAKGGLIDPNSLVNHISGFPLRDVVNHMLKQGHVKMLNHPYIMFLPEGKEFYRETSYVKEYDKGYEDKQIKDELSKLKLGNARRVFKSYPTTRFIAWCGFVSGLILLFLELAKALHIWPYHK
jgi:hypothetical protein